MIENIWCILCKDVITDSETGLVSYINCLEEIQTVKLPVVVPGFSIGTLWMKTTDSVEILSFRMRYILPSGKEKKPIEFNNIEMKVKKHRLNLVLQELKIEEEGIHRFVVEYLVDEKWVRVKELFFEVKVKK